VSRSSIATWITLSAMLGAAVGVWVSAGISGGHINPAVSPPYSGNSHKMDLLLVR
jgi:glycerol uptake facilitator-like aquaporin